MQVGRGLIDAGHVPDTVYLVIRRMARREIRAKTQKTRRLTAQHRRDIAALKRQVEALARTVAFLEKQEQRRVASPPAVPQEVKRVRFSARSVKAQRAGTPADPGPRPAQRLPLMKCAKDP